MLFIEVIVETLLLLLLLCCSHSEVVVVVVVLAATILLLLLSLLNHSLLAHLDTTQTICVLLNFRIIFLAGQNDTRFGNFFWFFSSRDSYHPFEVYLACYYD